MRRACAAARRPPDAVRLVAVTKSVEPPVAATLARTGQLDLGESRVHELERKHTALTAAGLEVRWHFLGHLQRNKARRVVALAHAIHSVDSVRLIDTVARLADELHRRPRLFLEVHLSHEPEKEGFAPDEVCAAVERAAASGLPLAGLMTMAPPVEPGSSDEPARRVFRELAALARTLPADAFEDGQPRLSMGMSEDFELAIAEGADLIRVGRALFAGVERGTPAASEEQG